MIMNPDQDDISLDGTTDTIKLNNNLDCDDLNDQDEEIFSDDMKIYLYIILLIF